VRSRLLATYLTVVVVALSVLVIPLGVLFASRERDRLFRDIEHDAVVVSGLVEDSLERGTPVQLGGLLESYARDPGGRIVVVDSAGRSVVDSEDPIGADFTNRPEIREALAGIRAEGSRRSDTLGGDLFYVAVPVTSGGVVHGAVRITYPPATLHERVRSAWLGLAGLTALVLVVVTVLGFVLARLVTRPVERLKLASRAVAAGDLSARVPIGDGAPELRELAVTFNDTVGRLQEILESHAAFVADASHQLRTPLAALRLQLENLEAAAPEGLQPGLAAARAETARLGRIGDQLLSLTRAAAIAAECDTVDLSAIVVERIEAWRPVAGDASVELVVDIPDAAPVSALPGALEQVLDNLLDNAFEVAPPGSTLWVRVIASLETTELHVVDEGPGLDPEQRERALDRFWRGPSAPPGGTGLGLAIVEQLVMRSGGKVALHPNDPRGVDATVTLVTTTFTSP